MLTMAVVIDILLMENLLRAEVFGDAMLICKQS